MALLSLRTIWEGHHYSGEILGEGKTTVVLQIIAKLTKGEAILSETSEGKSERQV